MLGARTGTTQELHRLHNSHLARAYVPRSDVSTSCGTPLMRIEEGLPRYQPEVVMVHREVERAAENYDRGMRGMTSGHLPC